MNCSSLRNRYERVREADGRIDLAELPIGIEGIALGWLHLDAVAVSDAVG